jgi:plasmid maintenance system antidote protein VapI
MNTRPISLSEQVRRAARESGVGCNRLARAIGLSKSAASRFLSGERGLSMTVLDRLGAVLGLAVVKVRGANEKGVVRHGRATGR